MQQNLELTQEQAQVIQAQIFDPLNGLFKDHVQFQEFCPFDSNENLCNFVFPTNAFPVEVANKIRAEAKNLCVDEAMIGMAVLAALSFCVQGKFEIQPKRQDPGWREPLNIYTFDIARSGEMKTPCFHAGTDPIREYINSYNEEIRPKVNEFNLKCELLKKRIDDTKSRLEKQEDEILEDDFRAVTDMQEALHTLETEESIHFLDEPCTDATPEALISIMERNDGRAGIMSSEGGILDTIAG